MTSCSHQTLELLPAVRDRLRCRHCHLTIKAEDLQGGCCPECYETQGRKRYDFEKVEAAKNQPARYRCLDCGVIIETTF